MTLRETQHRFPDTVQLDDVYLSDEHWGGKFGRSENKTPFVAAVSLNDKGRPQFVKLNRVSDFTTEATKCSAKANLAPTTMVVTDGLACFAAVTAAGCIHTPIVVGYRKPLDLPQFHWVNTILGNLKTTLHGAFHLLGWAKHADSHLTAFAQSWRSLLVLMIGYFSRVCSGGGNVLETLQPVWLGTRSISKLIAEKNVMRTGQMFCQRLVEQINMRHRSFG